MADFTLSASTPTPGITTVPGYTYTPVSTTPTPMSTAPSPVGISLPSSKTDSSTLATLSQPAPTTISSTSLQSPTPLITPPPQPSSGSTASSSLSATTSSYMVPPGSGAVADQNGNYSLPLPTDQTSQPDVNSGIKSLLSSLNDQIGTKSTVQNSLNSQFGVDTKQQAYIDAYNQYNQKKLAYQQQIESLYNQPGVTREQAQQQVGELQRSANADLANLGIIAQSAQGNYQGALDIVDRKLKAEFDPIQQQIDNYNHFIENNYHTLTDRQITQLQNQKYQLENNMQSLREAKLSAHQFALAQGINDPRVLNSIDNAQTLTDVYTAVGGNAQGLPSGGTGISGGLTGLSQTAQQYVDQSSDGIPYVSQSRLDNLTPYQKQILSAEYAKAGVRILQPTEVSTLGTIDEAKTNLQLFSQAANSLLSSGILGRIKGFSTNYAAQILQNNPEWRQFQTLRAGLIKSVQGVAAGAPGLRVTGAELANAADALPNSTDNLESAQQAIKTFNDLLDVNRNVLLRGSVSTSTGSTSNYSLIQTKVGSINPNF